MLTIVVMLYNVNLINIATMEIGNSNEEIIILIITTKILLIMLIWW